MGRLTTCVLDCPDRCSIRCRVEAGGVRLRGDPDHPYTRGFTCAKIRRYPARLASPHRIREPWVRDGADGFRPATWDEALDRVCGAIEAARAKDPAGVLYVRGAGSMGASKALADYVFRSLGARTVRGTLCDGAGGWAVAEDAGSLDMNDPAEIDRADAIVLWGKNPRANSVHTAAQVVGARKRGAPVIAINPDTRPVAPLADRVVRVRPGTDRFLAVAVARLLLDTPGVSPPWDRIANRAGFETLLDRHPVAHLLDRCGVAEADARAVAGLYAAHPRTATVVGWGLQRHPFGAENVRAIHAVAVLAGTLGIPGGGLYYNVPSSRHLRPPRPERRWSTPLLLPVLARELGLADPPVRVAWVTGSNLLNQAPDAKALAEAFRRLDLVVAVDGFWTETARRAHVVLPPALWLEEEDLVGSYWNNTIGAVRRVVDPPEGCRTDFEIARLVAGRLGVAVPFPDVDAWLAACLPSSGPDLASIRSRGWTRMPWPAVAWADGFAHPHGKFRLLEAVTPEPQPDPRFPLRLLTLVRQGALHSQMLPEEQRPPLPVAVHPDTAARLGLEPGDATRVVSAVGELEAEVRLDPGLDPGSVACPRGGWLSLGTGVNGVVPARLTDHGNTAAYYAAHVRLERLARS